MRRYTPDEELRIRLQDGIREWARSGLLSEEQRTHLEPQLAVDVRRTNGALRLGLAVFTLLAAGAAALLVFVTFEPRRNTGIAAMCMLLGVGAFAAADLLVGRFRLYRYGVEEALAVLAVLLCGAGAGFAAVAIVGSSHDSVAFTAVLLTCATVSGAAYVRFGFQYAAVASLAFAAAVPLAIDAASGSVRRLTVCALFLCASYVARRRSKRPDDVSRDDASMVAACAVAGAYLVVNMHVGISWPGLWYSSIQPWFKWTTYALTWLIPVFAIWGGAADRDRRVMRVGMAAGIVTLITNELYLGWPRQTWDPMLLGIFLIAAAIVVRRWLASGPGGERHGFTPARILHGDAGSLRIASLASVGIHPGAHTSAPTEPDMFRGGRSGGGGASGEFSPPQL
jgi:hypothetical protein